MITSRMITISVIVSIIVWLLWDHLKTPKTDDDTPSWLREKLGGGKFLKENWFVVLFVIFSFHMFFLIVSWLFTDSGEWYRTKILSNGLFWVPQAVLAVYAVMLPKGTDLIHHRVAKPMIYVALAVTLLVVFAPKDMGSKIRAWWNKTDVVANAGAANVPAGSTPNTRPLLPENAENKAVVEEFWLANVKSESEARRMIEICRRESGFNQVEADGTPYLGRANPLDVGICQVNLHYWQVPMQGMTKGEKLGQGIGCDIFTLKGNLCAALWIYHRMGAGAWNTSGEKPRPFNKDDYTMEVPVAPEKSDRIPIWAETRFTVSGPSTIFDDEGRPYEFDKGGQLDILPTSWIVVQSRTQQSQTVRVYKVTN